MTIGEKLEHIEAVTLEEAQAFYSSFYAPNNAILVVAGDVRASEVERLAQKWFGDLPARQVNRPTRSPEPPQTQARRQALTGPVPQTAVYRAYPCPARTDAAYPVVDLLTDLLSNGQAGRLYQHLVKDKQLATQAGAFTWGLYDPGMLSVDARLVDGVDPDTYLTALEEVLASLQHVPSQELLRIQNKIEAQEVFQRTKVLHRALALALFASMGHPEWINTIVEQYRAVRPTDVEAAAAEWLSPTLSTTLVYGPEA
jgi:Predicted Zn-dependent peptidases